MIATTALYIPLHFLACLLFFAAVQRPAFMLANARGPQGVSPGEVGAVYRAGLKTDLAASAYLTALPLLTLTVCGMCGWRPLVPMYVCEGVVALALSLATVADTALYRYWQAKIDASVLSYVRFIWAAFASVTVGYAVAAVMAVLLLGAAIYAGLASLAWLCGAGDTASAVSIGSALGAFGLFLLYGAALFACIRGLGHRPNSPAIACHSPRPLPNHCALNPVYNVLYTISLREKSGNPFLKHDRQECDAAVAAMFPTDGEPSERLLRVDRPNVLVIVWESLCEHFVESIGGKRGVTPELCRLCGEGVLFTNVTAGSWRTDPALVCVLSGMPGQPTANVIRQEKTLPRLPALPRTLREHGYATYAYHGGSLNYMNFVGYLIASGHDHL